jgi:hypothetical protein
MLIEVKASQKTESSPQGRQRFEFAAAERLSRLPAVFAMVIIGIAAYLRSMTPSLALTEPATNQPATEEKKVAVRDIALAQVDEHFAANGVDETETGSVQGGPANSIGRGNPWPANFQVPDWPQFHFVAPDYPAPKFSPFVPVAILGLPMNDNFGPYPSWGGNAPYGDAPGIEPIGPATTSPGDEEDEVDPPAPSNRAPLLSGPVRLNDVFAGKIMLVGLVHLLRGASDPDGDALSVTNVTVTGAELVAGDSGWVLKTAHGMVGPVVITYRISDGEAWVAQTASLDIVRRHFDGSADSDIIIGSPYDDDIDAGDGDDIVDALEGNDHAEGGAGNDHINGGVGHDVLVGGLGDDLIFGGAGNDILFGDAGDDRLFGEDGDDTLFGGSGDDHLDGGAGDDHIDGGEGCDTLIGGDGLDRLVGGAEADLLDGGAGNDIIEGGEGCDTLLGGPGDDILAPGDGDDHVDAGSGDDVLLASAGYDVLAGGNGFDTLDASSACADITVDLVGGTLFSTEEELGTDTFSGIEAVVGGTGDDLFIVGGKASVLSGGRGRDTFVFEVTDNDPDLSDEVVHQILDFVVGDRVRVRDYDLDRDQHRAEQDLFAAVYGDDDDDWLRSDVPIQLRHERIGDEDWTIILADIDGDQAADIAINIQGVLLPTPDHLA